MQKINFLIVAMFSPLPLGVRWGLDPIFLIEAIPHIQIFRIKRIWVSKSYKTKKLLSVKVESIMINKPINLIWPLRPRRIRSDFGKAIFMVSGDQKKIF